MNSVVERILGERTGKPDCKIEIECNDSAAEAILPLLKELRHMCNIGSSRTIKIEDWDGDSNFGIDGDGPDRIIALKLNGEKVE